MNSYQVDEHLDTGVLTGVELRGNPDPRPLSANMTETPPSIVTVESGWAENDHGGRKREGFDGGRHARFPRSRGSRDAPPGLPLNVSTPLLCGLPLGHF